MMQMQEKNKIAYPCIDLYSSSRVFNQRVNNSKIPLLKYREQIKANNCSKSNDADFIESSSLRKLQQKDGLIFNLKNMRNTKNPVSKIGRMKILICVCMYNQSRDAINLTLNGIYKNLKHLRDRGIPQGDVAVVLIQDGILKLVQNRVTKTYVKGNKSMIKFYQKLDQMQGKPKCELKQRINIILNQIQNYDRKGMMGIFPPSIQKNIALVYQNLWHPSKTYFEDAGLQQVPYEADQNKYLRLFSCFKHSNGTKLSSHLWFFEGFCRYLKPQFCVLLDVGTTPDQQGLANLISGFSKGSNIGGVTGFMNVDIEFKSQQGGGQEDEQQLKKNQQNCWKEDNCCVRGFFSIERAQRYEYTISHFLDKNQESALGFLHVLPGAWSAYRYDALIKSDKYEPNLLERSYFKMILNPDLQQKDYQQANMYLAEDRILSLGIYCQMDEKYILKYVPDAGARTDPMKDHENLMNQRRRWINSSLFAFKYVLNNYYFNVMDSHHNFCRKYVTLNISMWLALISTLNSYITPSIYFFVLYASIYQTGLPKAQTIAAIVCLVYTLTFLSAVAGALTGRQWSKHAHILSGALTFFTILLLALVVFNVLGIYLKVQTGMLDLNNITLVIILILTIVNLGSFFFILILHLCTHPCEVLSIFTDTISYIFYTGAYSQTMVVHAFCNVDDVSWGTKGSSSSGVNKYQTDKVYFVSTWIFVNIILTFIFLYVDIISKYSDIDDVKRPDVVLIAIAIYGSAVILIKTLFASYHQLKWMLCQRCCNTELVKKNQQKRVDVIDQYWRQCFRTWISKKQQFYKNTLSFVKPRNRFV